MPIQGVTGSSGGRKPSPPTIGTATAGNTQASVPFTVPTYLGKPGNNNLYTATSNPGGQTGTSTTSPITVTGLTNGTAYTFTVTASTRLANNTVVAISNPSSASNSITPIVPPFFPPFFPPYFPYFPFFPPFFPFFPPYFPYFPFFPPYFKPAVKCLHEDAKVLTSNGYVMAKDLKVGDKLLTVSPYDLTNYVTFVDAKINENVSFVETEILTIASGKDSLVKFNKTENIFSLNHPIFVKNGEGIIFKNSGNIALGDYLVEIDPESGNVKYTMVESIELMNIGNIYDIRTTPFKWYIVGNYLTIA
jgi:hypothetical protein